MVLRFLTVASDFVFEDGLVENLREVEAARLPVVNGFLHFEFVTASDHLVDGAETESRHDLAKFLRNEPHEVDDILRFAGETRAKPRVLRRDANGTGVEVADAHHDAAERDERPGGEPEFLGAEQRGDGNVAAGLELAVGLDDDATAEIVQHERLVRLGEAEFPRDAGVFDRRERRRARAAVVAADENNISVRFRDARGDGADTDFGDELDADASMAIGVLEVVDQFREVFDGIDVVMGRGTDESDAGRRVASLGDPRIDFAAGEFAAFAGLGALGHLDLQLLRVDEVVAGDAETSAGDLFDGGVLVVAIGQRMETSGGLRRLRRCWTCRRDGSWRWRAFRGLPG